jgi:hydroxyacylglutathione hydrolase
MEILPLVDEGLGNSSYLVGLEDGRALVVDPVRDPSPYLAEAELRGWRITHSLDTHLHADFVSGGRELAARGAELVAPAQAGLEFSHHPLGPEDELELGGLTLRALGTPGHTPEHLAYLLIEGDHPLALFSGGSLLVGSVARTDLISPDQTEALSRALFRTLRGEILALPDDVAVYPTHGAGSFCTTGASGERATTIGRERATNPLLRIDDEDTFVATLLGGLGTFPHYFLRLREVNRRGARVYGDHPPVLQALSVQELRLLLAEGAELIDVRPGPEFAAGHIGGALSIALRDTFPAWLGWLAPEDRPLVFVLGETQDRKKLIGHCLKIGYEELAGELEGGMEAWRAAGLEVRQVTLASPGELGEGTILDVRQADEFSGGHIPGATHVELGSLTPAGPSLPHGPLTLHCASGARAMTGASLLERQGRREVRVMSGGPHDWSSATGKRLEVGA